MADIKLQKLEFFINKSLFLLGEEVENPKAPQRDDEQDIKVFESLNTSILTKFADLFNLKKIEEWIQVKEAEAETRREAFDSGDFSAYDEFLKTEIKGKEEKKKELLLTIIKLMKSQYEFVIRNKDSEIVAEKANLRTELQTEHDSASAELKAANEGQKKAVAISILSRKVGKLNTIPGEESANLKEFIETEISSLDGDGNFDQGDFIGKLDKIRSAFAKIYEKKAEEEQSSCDATLDNLQSFFDIGGGVLKGGGGGSSRSSIKRTMKKRKRTNRKLKKRSRKNRSRQNRSSKRRTSKRRTRSRR